MNRRDRAFLVIVLIAMGAGWGITIPLGKIAVSTGHKHFGLIFWQFVIGIGALGLVSLLRGSGLPRGRAAIRVYVIIAFVGTLIPNSASFQAIAHLPSGVMSILLSLIPMVAFPIALGLRLEGFSARRFVGLAAGLCGVMLLVLPAGSLPDAAKLIWVPVALVAVACYAFEGNFVAKWGIAGLDAVQVMFGASCIGAALVLPLAIGTGQFISPFRPWGAPEWAFLASSLVHVAVYCTYVWLVGRAGPVFSVQVSYLVTGFGVFWAMVILGETYSPYFWTATALMLTGVFLVQPRAQDPLAPIGPIRDTAR